MVYVRLEQAWVDGAGVSHAAGDMVDVDAGTLAQLEAGGVVTAPAEPEAADAEVVAEVVAPQIVEDVIVADPAKGQAAKAWAGPGSSEV